MLYRFVMSKADLAEKVKTKECGTLYFSEGDYVLVEDGDECPYCTDVMDE